jgi:DeoR/GlpR family transcriptional regulator of sugar metabolism
VASETDATSIQVDTLNPVRRRERIAEYVLGRDSVSAKELSSTFDVSLMTIHRDLDELERQGVLRKIRGGATPQPSSLFESSVRFRRVTALREKEAVARYALTLVEPGQSVLLDDSTTSLALARLLPQRAPITMITNFLETINVLRGRPGVRLIALGGDYLERHDALVGLLCVNAIASLHADVVFLSTSAVSNGHALHQEQEIVSVKRAMLRSASRSILLIDHSKLDKVALHRLAPLREFDLVVVDSGVSSRQLAELRESPVEVVVAPLAIAPVATDLDTEDDDA